MNEKQLKELIIKSEDLQRAIRISAKSIDNPVLTTSIVVQLENFIDYLKDED